MVEGMKMKTLKPLPTYDNYSGDKHSSEDKCYELPVTSGSQTDENPEILLNLEMKFILKVMVELIICCSF